MLHGVDVLNKSTSRNAVLIFASFERAGNDLTITSLTLIGDVSSSLMSAVCHSFKSYCPSLKINWFA